MHWRLLLAEDLFIRGWNKGTSLFPAKLQQAYDMLGIDGLSDQASDARGLVVHLKSMQ